jgi:hypothetical protein
MNNRKKYLHKCFLIIFPFLLNFSVGIIFTLNKVGNLIKKLNLSVETGV